MCFDVFFADALNYKLSCAVFWGSFFSPFMSSWMGKGTLLYFSDFLFGIHSLQTRLHISVPKETNIYLAAGNTASCTAQGFFEDFFYGNSVFMNAILALTYCVIVKRGRKDEATGSLWIVSYSFFFSAMLLQTCLILLLPGSLKVLGFPPLTCFLLALMPLFNRAYNPNGFNVCGIAEYPLGCLNDSYPYTCKRGENARFLSIIRFAFIFLGNLTIVASVSILILHVISRERRMNTNPGDNANNSSIKATWQGIFHVAAFIISWGPWCVWQVS